jgi:DNA-binding NtrC family response regulator
MLAEFKVAMPEMPVVMITAHGTEEMAAEAVRRGAWAFIHKPFDVEEIAALVDKALAPG